MSLECYIFKTVGQPDEYYMKLALEEARKAFEEGEVPVGAVLVVDGKVVAKARNRREALSDPTAHAERLTLSEPVADSWHRIGATLYVTKEPCAMCAGAMVNARLSRLVYGCADKRFGAVDNAYNLLKGDKLNHRVEVTSGVLEAECAELLKRFFSDRRGGRVVECGGLENRCGGDSTGGSNPPLSATKE